MTEEEGGIEGKSPAERASPVGEIEYEKRFIEK